MLCGTPTQINLKDGINIFEIPVPQIALDPYTLNSENFRYVIIDRCGYLQKFISFSVRNATRIILKTGKKLF